MAAQVGSKKVITFTGMRFDGMDPDRAIAFFTFSNTYLALLFAFVAIDVFVRNAIG